MIDYNKGLWSQLDQLQDNYDEWVNLPIDRPIRMFDNQLLENITTTFWYSAMIFWIPILFVVLFIEVNSNRLVSCRIVYSKHLQKFLVSLQESNDFLLSFGAGILVWSLTEYVFHRFLFHMKVGNNSNLKKFHFIVHGAHHKFPFDKTRLIFPPIFSLFIVIFYYNCLISPIFYGKLFNDRIVMAGGISGYLIYDSIHYYLHHGNPINNYFYNLKRYHASHHFINHNNGFGVSSILWDKIFNTKISLRKLKFRLKWC